MQVVAVRRLPFLAGLAQSESTTVLREAVCSSFTVIRLAAAA